MRRVRTLLPVLAITAVVGAACVPTKKTPPPPDPDPCPAAPAANDIGPIDFESYVLGSINGQNGWSATGAFDQAIVETNGFPAPADCFGSQAWQRSNATVSGSFADHPFTPSLPDEAGETAAENGGMSGGTRQPYFEAEWQFASAVPGSEQVGLSVVASPDRGDGARMSWVEMADTPTGLAVNFYDYQTGVGTACDLAPDGSFVLTNVASGLDRAVPHTIKIGMALLDGPDNDIVALSVDGVLVHLGTSWEGYFNECENVPTGNPTRTVDSVLFRTGGSAGNACLGCVGLGFLIENVALGSGPLV